MFKYEFKKLLSNRFFLGMFVLLFILNMALSYTEVKRIETISQPTYDEEAVRSSLELYAKDPEAWQKEYKRVADHYFEKLEEARKEAETLGLSSSFFQHDEDTLKYDAYRKAVAIMEKTDTFPKEIKRVVRAASAVKEDLLAAGVSPSDYEYEYQDDIVRIYSVNAHIPLKYEYLCGWDEYFSYTSGNVLLVMMLLVLAPCLCLEEHTSGMYPILYATKKGRLPTILCKLGVLLSAVAGCVLVFSSTTLAFFGAGRGFSSLGNYIQAFEDFKFGPQIVTVGEYLAISVGIKILVLFAVGTVFMMIASLIKKYSLTFVVSLLFVGLNLVLHFVVSIDMASLAGSLRLIGMFTVMDTNTAFAKYYALNLFNHAASYLSTAVWLYVLIALIGAAVTVLLFCHTKGRTHTKRSAERKRRQSFRMPAAAIPLPGRSLCGVELHKNLISNKFVLVVVALIAVKAVMSAGSFTYQESFSDQVYREYTMRLSGELTQEKIDFIDEERIMIDETLASRNQMLAAFQNGEITQKEFAAFQEQYGYASDRNKSLERIEAQRDYILTEQAAGKTAHILYDTGWREFFSKDFDFILYGLCLLLFAGIFADEYRDGAHQILRASKKGRGKVFAAKYLTSLVTATVLFAIFTAIDLRNAFSILELPAWGAPVQSLPEFGRITQMSLTQYVILWISVRYLALLLLTTLLIGISLLTKKTLNTLGIVAIATVMPYLLRRLGLDVAKYFDYTYFLNGTIFLQTAAAHPAYLIFFCAAVAVAVTLTTAAGQFIWTGGGINRTIFHQKGRKNA